MNGVDFLNDFNRLIEEDPNIRASYFDYFFYSKQLLSAINKKIMKKQYDLQTDNNLFGADLVGFEVLKDQEDMKNEGKEFNLKPNVWDPKIAIIHETDSKQWMVDLMDLTYIKCPLKVIISYVKYDERENEGELLDFATRWVMRSSGFELKDHEEYLIILGNSGNKKVKDEQSDFCDYRGYYFDYRFMRFVKYEDQKLIPNE